MLIKYYLNNKEYASRTRENVPRIGEKVRFKGLDYNITSVLWNEDFSLETVYITIV